MLSNRDVTFDIMKGFLIILVVLGHAIQFTYRSTGMNVWLNPGFNFIYTFHMPLFIFVSGYFFPSSLKRNFEEVATSKFKRLLFPTIVWSSLLILLYVVIKGDIHLKVIYIQCKTYWYLICVFILSLVYWYFFRSEKRMKCILVITYLSFLLFYDFLPGYVLKDCQLIRQTFIFGFGAFLSMYRKDILNRIKYNVRSVGVFLILSIVISTIRVLYGFNMMSFPPIIRIIDGFVCSMFVIILVYPLFHMVSIKPYIKPLAYIGRNSLAIYLVHVVFSRACLFMGVHLDYTLSNVFIVSFCWLLLSLGILNIIKKMFKERSYIWGV